MRQVSRRRRRLRRVAALGIVLALVVWRLAAHPPAVARAELPSAEPAGARDDSLIVEPDAGMAPIYALLSSPRRSLDLTMYELVDPTAESLLADDAARGVRVRVVLDHRLEGQRNEPAYDFLRSRGVEVQWASGRYFVTHEKAFVIDDQTAVVMSLNLAARYYATSRDVAVIDHDPRDVAAVESVFGADLHGAGTGTPAADDLVWSPGQSQADLLALIDGARRSVAVESEELSSAAVIRSLTAAARRGVAVTVVMTYDSDAVPGFNAIVAAGGRVALLHGETPRYIHAKLLAVDAGTSNGRAFVGSENLSDASLLHDRELGMVLVAPGLVGQVTSVIGADLGVATPWP
jgi:phosphatidylserine/phosphatidylglycerophosphate/cardiolipin synthase-like enzyme